MLVEGGGCLVLARKHKQQGPVPKCLTLKEDPDPGAGCAAALVEMW